MKDAKQKKLTYRLIERGTPPGEKMYALLDTLHAAHHQDIRQARIALAWNLSWKPDQDGRATLGKCKRVGNLDREFIEYDFIIILLKEFWESLDVNDEQRRALLDHELTHCAPVLDKDGEPVQDERGRKVYRLRKHDIQEFSEIVRRHGSYTKELEQFWHALEHSKQGKLFDREPDPDSDPEHEPAGPVAVN